MSIDEIDVAIIGGGVVGLATALALTRHFPKKRILLLEKEGRLAAHQTGHNSGVIHSGIYYRPGSLKAALCVRGAREMLAFCQSHEIPVEQCGKVIVATSPEELPRLEALYQRGIANGVAISRIGPERLREIEPHTRALRALHVPGTGIVDFTKVALCMARMIEAQGGAVRTLTRILGIQRRERGFLLETSQGEFHSRCLINCGGLHADRLARMTHPSLPLAIVPFRGEYEELIPPRRGLVRGLIYPVPNPSLPFLGVHLSRRIDGRVEAGPNAVLAFQREGYRKRDFNPADLVELLRFSGFWRMSKRYWRSGLEELIRSFRKSSFVRSVQRLVPEIQAQDLIPSESGVRAQAVDRNGSLLDDFHLVEERDLLHVVNAPSPAATASLAIGETIASTARQRWSL